MHHFLLRHHLQKKILFNRNKYIKDINCLNKLTKLLSNDMEKKKLLKIFFWCQQLFRHQRRDCKANKHAETIQYGIL